MQPTEVTDSIARTQLEKILSSRGFARNDRLSRFLTFVVDQQLSGTAAQVKESLVGVEVFGRKPDYDPKRDSVVRMEAGKLRARLSQYYASDGAADPVVIELPKGGYVPVLRYRLEATTHGPLWIRKRVWLAVAAAACMALGAIGWWWVQHAGAPIPIAVLPLNNLSEDAANDYFSDGLTGEIIRNLSIIDGLTVRSQTSSFNFKGKPRDIREAGRQLDADYILEGSVQRTGRQLRVNAQFVRVRDDFPVWSGKFDRELTDVFAIQDEISRGIVNSLRLRLGRGRRRYETSTEAYDFYLRARALQIQRGFPGYNPSVSLLEQAIAKDPSFAPAYAALAAAHTLQAGQFGFDIPGEAAKMRAAAEKAIQLDPLLAEAHYALGMACARDARWEESEKSFRRAIELDPNYSDSRGQFAFFVLFPLGRVDEAFRQLRVAEKTNPLSPMVHYQLAYVLMSAGRYEEAAAHCPKSDFKSACLGDALLGLGKIDEAVQILETDFDDERKGSPVRGALGCAYARAGRREEAEKLTTASSPFRQAEIFACLGDRDRTFEALDRAAAAGPIRIGWALASPESALLRGDPRLRVLRKKVGLPE